MRIVQVPLLGISIVLGAAATLPPELEAGQVAYAPPGTKGFDEITSTGEYYVTVNGEPWFTSDSGDPRALNGTVGGRYRAAFSESDDLLSIDFAEGGTDWFFGEGGVPLRDFGEWRGGFLIEFGSGKDRRRTTPAPPGFLPVVVRFVKGEFGAEEYEEIEQETLVPVVWDEPMTAGAVERLTPDLTDSTWQVNDIDGPWANPNILLFEDVLDGQSFEIRLERFGFGHRVPSKMVFGIPEPSTGVLLGIGACLIVLAQRTARRKAGRVAILDAAHGDPLFILTGGEQLVVRDCTTPNEVIRGQRLASLDHGTWAGGRTAIAHFLRLNYLRFSAATDLPTKYLWIKAEPTEPTPYYRFDDCQEEMSENPPVSTTNIP